MRWMVYLRKIIDDNFAIVIESLGFALKIYGGDERFVMVPLLFWRMKITLLFIIFWLMQVANKSN
ncbi:Uncharacterised protein [Escherichia coli]|uniref:Uncharacterized protein n=1 Tax=Escherichia coli TaxID=562 RepID=A0A377CFR2_ECOLX|nr:Uncharacterised protein [Escherichia coli]